MRARRLMPNVAWAAVSCVMLIAGCATTTLAVSPPGEAAPKSFHVAPDEAGIYVIRSERVGGAIPIDVLIDGQRLGATVARSYLYAVVKPGTHTVDSVGDIRNTLEVWLEMINGARKSLDIEQFYISAMDEYRL